MRATTRGTPYVSRASRAEMMLELSPLDTAANASARSTPAVRSTSRSKPKPVTVVPLNSEFSRRNASEFWSMIDTECPRASRLCARVEPSRPHPMITTCKVRAFPFEECHAERATWQRGSVAGARYGPAHPAVRLALVARPTSLVKRLLVGRPFRSDRLHHTLLPKRIALPVFASDALSSVAYAPDEILLTLSIAGATAYAISPWVTLAVAVVMVTVVASYRQNVHAYPSGGGDYEVATVNLGPRAGLTVASALLVDYVLTVAVSISSGVQNAGSALPFIDGREATYACVLVVVLAALNLRGIRESGAFFAVPTYGFMVAIIGMALWGGLQYLNGNLTPVESADFVLEPKKGYGDEINSVALVFLLARAFSSGCAALTG